MACRTVVTWTGKKERLRTSTWEDNITLGALSAPFSSGGTLPHSSTCGGRTRAPSPRTPLARTPQSGDARSFRVATRVNLFRASNGPKPRSHNRQSRIVRFTITKPDRAPRRPLSLCGPGDRLKFLSESTKSSTPCRARKV